jgi:PKD repeat protein/ABC-type branched-subunit amino acid transport system substrate-binding protein
MVDIGVIAPTAIGLEEYATIIDLANKDITDYMAQKGLDYTFIYSIEDAQGSAAVHLEHVQKFKSMGVNLLIGGGWSSQASASLSYINQNSMLLISPSSTYPELAIPGDNLFRLCPDDRGQGPVIAKMLSSWGIKAIIVIQRGDAWADGIYNILANDFPAMGGVIAERLRYAGDETEFNIYLAKAEEVAKELVVEYGAEHVGIEIIAFDESVTIVTQARNYPTIYNLMWFGSDGTSLNQQLINNTPEESDHLKIFSPIAAPPDSDKYWILYKRYYVMRNEPLTFYRAALYDACWVYALSIIEANSDDAMKVKTVLPSVASNYIGASGQCTLNEAGDRSMTNYDIWGYGIEDSSGKFIKYGYYDGGSQSVIWDTTLITPPLIQNINPVAVINGPYSGIVDGSISFNSIGSRDTDGAIVEYNWNFGDGYTATSANPSHTYRNAGTYTVTFTVRDNKGATNTVTTQCTVTAPTPPNQAPVAAVNGPYSGKEDSSISFSSAGSNDPEGGSIQYSWDFGDGQTSTGANPSHTYEEAGAYTVTLRVTDDQGATGTATTSCTVEAAPKGGFPWLPIVVALVAVAAAAAFLYLQKMKPRVKELKPVEFEIGVEPEEIPADGRSSSIITIGLLDDGGKPIPAKEDMAVTISASGGVVVSSSEVKRDEATGAMTITDSVKQAIEGLLSRREEAGMRISVKQGGTGVEAAIVSSLEAGDVTLSVSAPGMRRRTVTMRFTEKRRYCMHCGASMSMLDRACPKCGLMPPSGVDVKSCPNCGEVIPSLAKFCSDCGAGQPKLE